MNTREAKRRRELLESFEGKKFDYYGCVYELISFKDDIVMLQSMNDDTYVTMPASIFLKGLRNRNIQQLMEQE